MYLMWLKGSELVCCVRAKQEFELEPERVLGSQLVEIVVVVLHPEFGKFRRIPGQVRREARLIASQIRYECRAVSAGELAPQPRHDARLDTPQHLGVGATILQRFAGKRDGRIG